MNQAQQAGNELLGTGRRAVSGIRDFLNSNTLVSKVVFLILVIIVFILLLRAGVSLMTWLFEPASSPHLTSGMKDAKKLLVIPQDPKNPNSIPVMRSINQRNGLEFTWTVWIYVDDLVYKNGQRKHIFHKGTERLNGDQTAFPNNGPGLYIHPTRNSLIVVMNTFKNILEEVEVTDLPLHKWVNVAIRVKGNIMDVFINGDVALRHVFDSVPKQNYGDVYVNMNSGFNGLLSDLWYHDYALSGTQIEQIVDAGPNMTMDDTTSVFPHYLSLNWFFQNDETPSSGPNVAT